jgi:hypothetical protein
MSLLPIISSIKEGGRSPCPQANIDQAMSQELDHEEASLCLLLLTGGPCENGGHVREWGVGERMGWELHCSELFETMPGKKYPAEG